MKQRWLKLLALLFAFTLIAAACGDDDDSEAGSGDDGASEEDGATEDDGGAEETTTTAAAEEETPASCAEIAEGGEGDLAGETVTILGPETANEAEGLCAALVPLVEETGVAIEYTGTRDAAVQTNVAVEAGQLPSDLVMIPQPGRIAEFAREGLLTEVPQETLDGALAPVSQTFLDFGTVDGTVYGVPFKADVKSLVWYSPSAFEENGYEIPQTLDELLALQDTMKENDQTPWCVGIESDTATGWPFTDWMEDLVLRTAGVDVYQQWIDNEVGFDDEAIVSVAEYIGDIWFDDANVLGGRDSIATTNFREAPKPMLDGECMMHRQASFAGAFFVEAGGTLGPDGDVSAFYFPVAEEGDPQVVLGGANIATAWNDRPATLAVLDHIGSAEAAEARIVAQGGGYYSPNGDVDDSLYPSEVDPLIADILLNAEEFGFDASDSMPDEVNSEFWQAGTDYVSGAIDAQTFAERVEATW